jgi:hypothetical protein
MSMFELSRAFVGEALPQRRLALYADVLSAEEMIDAIEFL